MGFLSSKIKQQEEVSITTPLDPKQIVSFEELLMSQVVQREEPSSDSLLKEGYSPKRSLGR